MSIEASSLKRHLKVVLDDGLDVAGYRRKFEVSLNVRDVSVKVRDSPREELPSPDAIKALFRGLRDLKKLKALSFEPILVDDDDGDDMMDDGDISIPRNCTVPFQTITAAVTHSRNLKDLFVANVVLRGSEQQLSAFSSVLRRRRSLEEFTLAGCRFATPTRAPVLDPLVRGIVDLPNIRVVHLQAIEVNHLGTLTSPAVSALCLSKTLKELKLFQFDLTDDQFMTAARSMETNSTLEELALGVINFTIVSTAALAKMLRRNSTLNWLELTPKARIEDKLLIQIAEAVEENSSLKHFALNGNFGPLSQHAKDAFERMLEENYKMESLRLYETRQTLPEFQMYLRLNRAGRNHLLEPKSSACRKDWIRAIQSVNDSLDCIFYCLSVNPFLCHTTEELQTQVRVSRRGNKRRRLNNDTSENSSSVNSSLSSSENDSSSPSNSDERQTSTDTSDNLAQNGAAAGGHHQVTSTSGSSNTNTKEEPSSSDQQTSSNPGPETSASTASGSGSNEGNGTARTTHPSPPQQGGQQLQQPPSQQAILEAVFAGLLGATPNAAASSATAPQMPPGLQALASQQQQPSQAVATQQQQQLQQQLGQQLGQLQALLQQQQQEQNQQLQPMMQQQQQQQILDTNTGNPTNNMLSMTLPMLMSSLLQQGQAAPQGLQSGQASQGQQVGSTMDQQLQQLFGGANLLSGMGVNQPQLQQSSSNQQQIQQGASQFQGHGGGSSQESRQQMQGQNATSSQVQGQSRSAATSSLHDTEPAPRRGDGTTFLLYMPRDKESLSSYQCFLRQQIELFEAGPEDVKSTMPGRNKAIVLGQVGIRCIHCASLPARYRGTGATYYPAKLDRLYQAAQNMAQTHFNKHCRHIPQEIVNELSVLLQGSKSSAGAGKKYWSDGARMIGVYEHEADDILRMDRARAAPN